MRASGGEGIVRRDEEVVPVVCHHDSLILRCFPEMNRVILRQRRLSIPGSENVQPQSSTDFCGRGGNVLVEIEPSCPRLRHRAALYAPIRRTKGNSSATRSGVQYASRASRASISSG